MEIVSIILRLKNQEIKVSVDEAKELLGQLTAVFGGDKPIIQKEYIPYPVYPQPVPVYPWYTRPWWEYQPIIIYDTGIRAVPQWRDNTCTISVCGTGEVLSSIDFNAQGTSWKDASGNSILGSPFGHSVSIGSSSSEWGKVGSLT